MKGTRKFFVAGWIFLVLEKFSSYFLDLRSCFSNQENISQYVLMHLQCMWTNKTGLQSLLGSEGLKVAGLILLQLQPIYTSGALQTSKLWLEALRLKNETLNWNFEISIWKFIEFSNFPWNFLITNIMICFLNQLITSNLEINKTLK